jgi:predicted ATPase
MGFESYDIKDVLAQSPSTVVRRAIRKTDGAPVVLKTLSREYPTAREIGQIEFEYRILRKLEAPGIVRALDLQKDGDRLFLVLEDYGGQSLASRTAGALPIEAVLDVAIAAARALGHIHSRGVIHKDVTPGNILLNSKTGAIKLIDFGISSELSHEHQGTDPAAHLEGTLPYISPEQTGRMNRDLDYRSDYYSLGVTLFELLTGSLPFSATDMMGWVHCHISKPAPNAREVDGAVPEMIARVVDKLMAKNPDDRYQSAHGLVKDLENCRAQWEGSGTIVDFALARHDVPERFQISQTLFGREREAAILLETFKQASVGAARLLSIAGYSGVGKSSLIHELEKDIVRRRGHFISGKFDQLERNVPYGAVIQALKGLVKQLLREPEERLLGWRQTLCAAVGSNGQVLVDLIPELVQVLGPQPSVPELPPREAQARLQRVFGEFLKAAAQPDHPLVLFVDDMQWADASTPELLVYLLSDAQLRHLLILGAYRDNEVDEGHLLVAALKQLRQQRADAMREIFLLPLSEESVNDIVADTLRSDREATRPLSALIAQKTGGNPFFVKELLNMLSRDGAFQFVPDEGRWEWDYDKISKAAVSDNVVDLMVERLRRLSSETTLVLRLAACVGNQFDLLTVSLVAEKRAGRVAAALLEAVHERVLIPLGGGYRLVHDENDYDRAGLRALDVRYQFQHDRVQQAAYSLLDPQERVRIHLGIGRLLLSASEPATRDANVFELVNHLNLGRPLITSLEERSELLRLNEVAGRKARHAAAYAIATTYFDTCAALLSEDEWAAQPQRLFACRRDRVECIFFAGDPDRALSLCGDLVASAPDKWCRVEALDLKAQIQSHQARLMEAIGTLREGLRILGFALPEDPAEVQRQIGEGIGKMQGHLMRTPIEEFVNLPEMVEKEKIAINRLLFALVIPAIQAYPPLFVLAELLMFDLALTHGTTAVSCKNFVDCGIIQGPVLGDYERAYRLGKVAFEFLKRDASKPLASAVTFVFASFVSHWRAHFREGLDAFVDAKRLGLELGDLQHAAYAHVLESHRWFFIGRELDASVAKADHAIAYLRKVRADNQLDGARLVQRPMARLRGRDEDETALREITDEEFIDRLKKSGNAQWLFLYGNTQTFASVLLGDFAAAETWDALASQFAAAGGNIHFSLTDHVLLNSLILANRCGGASEAERAPLMQRLAENEGRLKKWADNCPENFAHKHKLACAEIARARAAPMEEVLALYGEAVAAAGDGFIHLRALANERLADYWASKGQPKIARSFLGEAYFLYDRWGAQAKLRQLRQRHPKTFDVGGEASPSAFRTTTTTTHRTGMVQGGSLDLDSMIKATHAISSEVKPDRLFAKLMATIIENAGAQRGCLIRKSEATGELHVEAMAHVDGEPREARKALRIEDCAELCADIVRYVARTADTIVLDDATRDSRYQDDAYVRRNAVKSVLCMPVLNQGKLVAILYAENNVATDAFTSQRLKLLQIIASQAAISITNARLYDSLEEKVVERTRELTEKNAEVAAMLHSMQQGIFTIDGDLRIQPQYSAHLEQILATADIAGRDCVDMLFRGSSVSEDALTAMRSALEFSFGAPVFLAEVNWGHLVKEFHRKSHQGAPQYFEVEWNPIAAEGGEVRKVLVALRDVTLLKQLRETVAKNARELDIVGQILDAGPTSFHRFVEVTRAFMREILAVLRAEAAPSREGLALVFRNMHTVKGNARTLALSHLVDAVHAAEQAYVDLRADPSLVPDRERLVAGVDSVVAALKEYDDVCRRKLGDLTQDKDTRKADTLSDIGGIVDDAMAGALTAAQALAAIETALKRAKAVPLREVVKEGARMLPSLARELDKTPPTVDCLGTGIELTPAWAQVMRDVLVHAFRNALDHGIESTDERQAKGKAPHGRIAVQAARDDDRIVVRVSDDGQGLRLDALREKTNDRGGTDEEVAHKVFISGVSTAAQVSQVSGRGVGLDAVRSFMRRHGGEARIAFTGSGREGCRPFELVLELPEDAAAAESRGSAPPKRLVLAG